MIEPFLKKSVHLTVAEHTLELATAQSIFSSHQVDTGTQHLLTTVLADQWRPARKILDLGCGYGPLGLGLAKVYSQAEAHLVDRDALALALTRHNAQRNQISNIKVYPSLGYDDIVDSDYELIISNIPGKAGEKVITSLFLDARHFLSPTGMVAVVVVKPLTPMVELALSEGQAEILLKRAFAAHTVFHYRFPDSTTTPYQRAFERGIYLRGATEIELDGTRLTLHVNTGLREFDTLTYSTALTLTLLPAIQPRPKVLGVFNAGQGYLALAGARMLSPAVIHVVDRDLLALRTTLLNLQALNCSNITSIPHHQVALAPPDTAIDGLIGVLQEEDGPQALEQTFVAALTHLSPGSHVLIGGSSTALTRLERAKAVSRSLQLVKRKRKKGYSAALFRRR